MSEPLLSIPQACQQALAAIEQNPLELPPEIQHHLHTCAACSETRVLWLSQEEAPLPLVQGNYFQSLPDRILRKLPAPRKLSRRAHPALWLAAAAALAAASLGGFLAGKINRTPLVEARLPASTSENHEVLEEALGTDADESITQLSTLSPEETQTLLKRLDSQTPHP